MHVRVTNGILQASWNEAPADAPEQRVMATKQVAFDELDRQWKERRDQRKAARLTLEDAVAEIERLEKTVVAAGHKAANPCRLGLPEVWNQEFQAIQDICQNALGQEFEVKC